MKDAGYWAKCGARDEKTPSPCGCVEESASASLRDPSSYQHATNLCAQKKIHGCAESPRFRTELAEHKDKTQCNRHEPRRCAGFAAPPGPECRKIHSALYSRSNRVQRAARRARVAAQT